MAQLVNKIGVQTASHLPGWTSAAAAYYTVFCDLQTVVYRQVPQKNCNMAVPELARLNPPASGHYELLPSQGLTQSMTNCNHCGEHREGPAPSVIHTNKTLLSHLKAVLIRNLHDC
jgi:hypothetical protein